MFDNHAVFFTQSLTPGSRAPFQSQFSPCMIDEDLPHGACGKAEKMTPVGQPSSRLTRNFDVSLMDQIRCFKALAAGAGELPPGKTVELVVQQGIHAA